MVSSWLQAPAQKVTQLTYHAVSHLLILPVSSITHDLAALREVPPHLLAAQSQCCPLAHETAKPPKDRWQLDHLVSHHHLLERQHQTRFIPRTSLTSSLDDTSAQPKYIYLHQNQRFAAQVNQWTYILSSLCLNNRMCSALSQAETTDIFTKH